MVEEYSMEDPNPPEEVMSCHYSYKGDLQWKQSGPNVVACVLFYMYTAQDIFCIAVCVVETK